MRRIGDDEAGKVGLSSLIGVEFRGSFGDVGVRSLSVLGCGVSVGTWALLS